MGTRAPERPRSRAVIEAAGDDGVYELQGMLTLNDEATGAGGLLLAATGPAARRRR